ncbi:RNA polymerase sigma factor SigF [Actinoplanes sp. URMC 104]|uniref:RNA polymerase sigma factor SigF n=1 Tax=Actinoplanes sp. URMC 104 TaxID=3423409 RepID=UPI003F1E3505
MTMLRTTREDTAAELVDALSRMEAGDPARAALRERTIEAWLPMAHHLARRYTGRGEPTDDLVQVAVVGLIKSVDRYEPGHGVEFAGFAVPTILGEIKRHFRDRTWSIRVPRRLQELRMRITAANTELTQQMHRAPTMAEVAAHLEVTEEEVIEGLEGARAYQATSLSTPVGDEGNMELGDTLGAEDNGYELAEFRAALPPAVATLTPREQQIIALRFYGNQTQNQIAEKLGISQMHVSRLLAGSLAKLRKHMGGDD